jgi:hypothetical protein
MPTNHSLRPLVNFTGTGTCSLTASVTAGTDYTATPGRPQTFNAYRATPTTPTIVNLPTNAVYGGSFTADVSTNTDGTVYVTSNSTSVCAVSGLTVDYVKAGTCSLTASVTDGIDCIAGAR